MITNLQDYILTSRLFKTLIKYPEILKGTNASAGITPSLIPLNLNKVLGSFFQSLFSNVQLGNLMEKYRHFSES